MVVTCSALGLKIAADHAEEVAHTEDRPDTKSLGNVAGLVMVNLLAEHAVGT